MDKVDKINRTYMSPFTALLLPCPTKWLIFFWIYFLRLFAFLILFLECCIYYKLFKKLTILDIFIAPLQGLKYDVYDSKF